ncbi:Cdc25 phosphatase Ibp1 [Friedmanniomyces endolithicus]|nr:Cdc25 phosphatase Ibp1 [Friedmanniomyces endolithicus]
MSTATVANLPRISGEKLAALIRAKTPGITIIDVRGNDYIGGHILGCQNVPTSTHDHRMPELVRTLRNQNTIVFHCALSQQRGPSSALRYLRERERMSARGELGIREDGEDLEKAQRVVVLDGGFEKWQAACVTTIKSEYGSDPELTEDYVKDLWDENF